MSIDGRVKASVVNTPYYVEGCKQPIYNAYTKTVSPRSWIPITKQLKEMDIHQQLCNTHPHTWSLILPEDASIDIRHLTLTSNLRIFPTDGLLLHVKEEHLFEFSVNGDTNILVKKFN